MKQGIWLIHNEASGSNDEAGLARVREHCRARGLPVVDETSFPRDDLPTHQALDAAGIGIAALFAGDGTINAALDALAGWSGKVLVLPGGTMNLLFHRLFGDCEMKEAIDAVAEGSATTCRAAMIESAVGSGYAGVLTGPGTSWNTVREAMRNRDLAGMAREASDALEHTLEGPPVACVEPALGKAEGYPLIQLEPTREGIEITAFHAETTGEYVKQTVALLQHDFRAGPHDVLGREDAVTLRTIGAEELGLLLDGEPVSASGAVTFRLGNAEVDMLTTRPDG
ncbi:diacylglycerol/lipid kinase family protein [Aurantiacibacter suaedae]|uniref:diacylglycerol/lipid kinase family protein n=1 Tax=Aurantiacibacter suaedae TaxID=2545755 RepID=UPI001386F339|nr:diacylglycerol kinase family protein [Aurantiacibacter suaedae]